MKYLCFILLVIVVSVQAVPQCNLDVPFKDFSCKSGTFIACKDLPECICPPKSTCVKTKVATGSEECMFSCQSEVVENLIEKDLNKFEEGPYKK